MADDAQRPIVIRRKKKRTGRAHGGAWKIAYADFVTAMMAFFLLMWLLGSTTRSELNGIQEYFKTPLKVALQGGSSAADGSSIIKGGGKDLAQKDGQVRKGEPPNPSGQALKAAQAEFQRQEMLRLNELKQRIEGAIERNSVLKQFRSQLLLDITSEGLRVQIVDEKNRPMFAVGRAELQPYARELLLEIGLTLNNIENKISISGHTDATPYASGEKGYSNWELSADRANASRRVLLAGGLEDKRIVRVLGMASAVSLHKSDMFDAMNRRISLIVLNRGAAEALEKTSGPVDVGSREDVQAGKLAKPPAAKGAP
jgi:chemotaxis protein MotB